MHKIILASKSKVRRKILQENGIDCEVFPSNVDEEPVKESLQKPFASFASFYSYLLKDRAQEQPMHFRPSQNR